MATLTLIIPDDEVDRVVNTFAAYHAYQDKVSNPDYDPANPESEETIDNPKSKIQFLKWHIIKFVKEAVRAQENSAAILAAKSAVADVEGME